ncbi:unnamed protein product [Peniophora sp. CBMAI 1063]|nr:unnamed protein product [Peniophora sp. CBMAI 1063]
MASQRAAKCYAVEMESQGRGLALFNPNPGRRGPIIDTSQSNSGVEIGDVGHIIDGAFCFLFNIHRSRDDRQLYGVPEGFEVLPRDDNQISLRIQGPLEKPQLLRSGSQVTAQLSAGIDLGVLGGASTSFEFDHERGAALVYFDRHEERRAMNIGHYKRYFRKHYRSWLCFVSNLGRELVIGDLVLVTGCEHTLAWITFWKETRSIGGSVGLNVPMAVGGVSVSSSVHVRAGPDVHSLSGPWAAERHVSSRESPSAARLQNTDDPNPSDPPRSSPAITPTGPSSSLVDQCIFIRRVQGYKPVKGIPAVLKAAAGPSVLPPRDRDLEETQSVRAGSDDTGSVEFIEETQGSSQMDDSLLPLALRVVADEYSPSCENDILLLHDDELLPFLPQPDETGIISEPLTGVRSYLESRLRGSPPPCLQKTQEGWMQSEEETSLVFLPHSASRGRMLYIKEQIRSMAHRIFRPLGILFERHPDAKSFIMGSFIRWLAPPITIPSKDATLVHHSSHSSMGDHDNLPTNDRTSYSHIHALIIGIDSYEEDGVEPLTGAVADADAVAEYLLNDLGVAQSQIIMLRNEMATKGAILRHLRALCELKTLRNGDPIVVYFSGHGATEAVPDPWLGLKHITTVVPHDALHDNGGSMELTRISTQTLGQILNAAVNRLNSNGLGDNITLILDCCLAYTFERESTRDTNKSSPGFISSPYVTLCANQVGGRAYEKDGRGWFTRHLLEALRRLGPRLGTTTYQDLVSCIPANDDQMPRCEGRHSDRILFSTRTAGHNSDTHRVIERSDTYTMEAGSVHGIALGSHFSLYPSSDIDPDDKPLTYLIATSVEPFRTALSPIPDFSFGLTSVYHQAMPFSARPAGPTPTGSNSQLRVHVSSNSMSSSASDIMKALSTATLDMQWVDEQESDLTVRERDGTTEYFICDPDIMANGLHRLPQTTISDSPQVLRVLRAARHFLLSMRRSPPTSALKAHVRMHVHALSTGIQLQATTNTPHNNAIQHTFHYSESVLVIRDEGERFGLFLENQFQLPLHVWVFYYDCNDLSITELYRPPIWGCHGQPSLPGIGGKLSIGQGRDEGRAFTPYLRPGDKVGVGFIRAFVSTDPVDLSGIQQLSPFDRRRARGVLLRTQETEHAQVWDVISLAVVQKRHLDDNTPSTT